MWESVCWACQLFSHLSSTTSEIELHMFDIAWVVFGEFLLGLSTTTSEIELHMLILRGLYWDQGDLVWSDLAQNFSDFVVGSDGTVS